MLGITACNLTVEQTDKEAYQFKLNEFIKLVDAQQVDTTKLVDYDLLTAFADSIKGAHMRNIYGMDASGEQQRLSEIEHPIVLESFAS